jgi:hypothetical protein
MAQIYRCKCGKWFTGRAQLREHVAIYNLVAKDYDTMHCEVIKTQVEGGK